MCIVLQPLLTSFFLSWCKPDDLMLHTHFLCLVLNDGWPFPCLLFLLYKKSLLHLLWALYSEFPTFLVNGGKPLTKGALHKLRMQKTQSQNSSYITSNIKHEIKLCKRIKQWIFSSTERRSRNEQRQRLPLYWKLFLIRIKTNEAL